MPLFGVKLTRSPKEPVSASVGGKRAVVPSAMLAGIRSVVLDTRCHGFDDWDHEERAVARKSENTIVSVNRDRETRAAVGQVTPCAPSFALWESVVAAVGAQRTARPTLRFVGSRYHCWAAHRDHEPRAKGVGARAPWTAATESLELPLWVALTVWAAAFA